MAKLMFPKPTARDKATVKKIQRALKKNGYYLSYKKHYLKVDGLYGPALSDQ